MCNETQMRLDFGSWWGAHGRARPPVTFGEAASNRPLDRPFKPTNRMTMLRAIDPAEPMAGLEAVDRRWWLVPFFHKGDLRAWRNMCTNARIETVDTLPTYREAYKRRRALIPITSFIEYDVAPGAKKSGPKRRWEATWTPADDFDQVRYLAAVWDRCTPADMPEGVESFAFVTGPPGPDVAAVHDREPAVLTFDAGLRWLDLSGPGKGALVTATPAGTYRLTPRPREMDMAPGDPAALL